MKRYPLFLFLVVFCLSISPLFCELGFAGMLYGAHYEAGPDIGRLYQINPADGFITLVTDSYDFPLDGLAYVPEPATILLLGLGALLLRRKR